MGVLDQGPEISAIKEALDRREKGSEQPTGTKWPALTPDAIIYNLLENNGMVLNLHKGVLISLLVLTGCLTWALWPVLIDMNQRWEGDPRYAHGYLVPMFALAMLWMRRSRLAGSKLAGKGAKIVGSARTGACHKAEVAAESMTALLVGGRVCWARGGRSARRGILSDRLDRGLRSIALLGRVCAASRGLAGTRLGVAFDRFPRFHDPAALEGGKRAGAAVAVDRHDRSAPISCRPSGSWPSPKGT